MKDQAKSQKGKIHKQIQKYGLECTLREETMTIEVTEAQSDVIYWITLSNDTIPVEMKFVFPTPESIYQFFQEPTDNGQITIPSIEKIVINFKVGKKTKEVPIYLDKKIISNEDKLLRRINSLEKQVEKLKSKVRGSENFKDIQLEVELQSKQMTIDDQQEQIKQLKLKIESLQNGLNSNNSQVLESTLKKNAQLIQKQRLLNAEMENYLKQFQNYQIQIKQLKQQNQDLKAQKIQYQQTIVALNGEIASHKLIYQEITKEVKENRELISALTSGQKQVIHQNYGKLLTFKPLQSSVNFKCYNFTNNMITKNNQSFNGTGRMIPCSQPIPMTGRYHYKFINRNVNEHPNFRIGVISRSNLGGETYMNGGDTDAVMYYCYSTDKEILYEGTTKLDGFNIFKGNEILVLIDRDRQQVEWFIDNHFKALTRFTQSMKNSENLYFFVQLWANGDALQILDR